MDSFRDPLLLKAYQAKLGREEGLACRIVSDSMHPLIKVNEVVHIEKLIAPMDVRIFDIIVFLYQEKFFCHFVWKKGNIEPESLCTRSLKDPLNDDIPIRFDQILGRVTDRKMSAWSRAKINFWNVLRNRG